MTMHDAPKLPPMMGFPQEKICIGGALADFYTCVIEPFRVFVWMSQDMWFVQTAINDATGLLQQFYHASSPQHRIQPDPITLMAVIRDLTSEGNMEGINEKPVPTTGTDDDVLPSYLEKGGITVIDEWERTIRKVGARLPMLDTPHQPDNVDRDDAGMAGS